MTYALNCKKTDIALTVTILHPLLQQIWNTETFPDDWNEGILIPLPLHIIQIFTYIIMTRLKCIIEPSLTEKKNGFCEISSSHGGEYDVQNCLLGCNAV
jgi:hypothetical protein